MGNVDGRERAIVEKTWMGFCSEKGVDYEMAADEYLIGFHGKFNTALGYITKIGIITHKRSGVFSDK